MDACTKYANQLLIPLVILVIGFALGYNTPSPMKHIKDLRIGQEAVIKTTNGREDSLIGCSLRITTLGVAIPSFLTKRIDNFPNGIACGSLVCGDSSLNRRFECAPVDFLFKTDKQRKENHR